MPGLNTQKQYSYPIAAPNRKFYENGIAYKKILADLGLDFYKIYFNIINKYTCKADIILDAGCGTGKTTAQISETRKVIGIDWSLEFLKEAKQGSSHVAFIQGDLCDIPITNDSIDVVAAYDVLEHIYDAEKFLKEVERILRRGGRLFIVSPNYASPFMPLLSYYYSKKYRFKRIHRKYVSFFDLLISQAIQTANFITALFSKRFIFKYRKLDIDIMEYPDDDSIFYSSYFLIRYLKNIGYKIVEKMAAPISNIKYLFAKIFPPIFTTMYIIVEKE